MSGEDQQDRSDRAILTPWVKFLWESYRQCLDLLRNDSSVERLYQDIAQQGEAAIGGKILVLCTLMHVLFYSHRQEKLTSKAPKRRLHIFYVRNRRFQRSSSV